MHTYEARNTSVKERCISGEITNPVIGTGIQGRSKLSQAGVVVNTCFAEILLLLL